MNRKQWLWAIPLAALLAAAVTWQLRRHREDPPARAAAALGHNDGGHGHGRGGTPIDEPELRSGPPRIIADDDPAGALRLEGQVVDRDTAPVGGAVVALSSQPPRQTRTAADGSFAFDGLLARPYTITARSQAGVAGPVTARLTATSDPVVLQLRDGAVLDIEVVDAQQRPIDGATVEVRGIEVQTFTTARGKVRAAPVAPGFYRAAAWADGYARAFLPAMVSAGTTSLRLELARGAPVSGKVLDERGAPVAQARVRYETASDFLPGSDLTRDAVMSGADGSFSFPALPAGSFRFIATDREHASGVTELTSLDGVQPRNDVVVRMPAGATLRGKVVTADGKPLDAARVRVGMTSASMRVIVPPREAYSDASGAFVVTGLPRRPLTALALHELGASAALEIDTSAGDVADVVLKLDATGAISGVVVDAEGQPVEGAQVSALPDLFGRRGDNSKNRPAPAQSELAQWQLRGFPQELSNAGGEFRLTGMAPGTYRVHATRSAAVSRGRGMMSEGIEVATGASGVRIVLPAEGGVRGKVAFADGGAPERFTAAVGFAQESFAKGEFALDALTPQRYQLVLRGDSFATRVLDVVVEPGEVADLGTVVVVAGRTLRGSVVREGQPVAGAKVYAGAQLIGSGSSASGAMSPMMRGVKETLTGADGSFSLQGFGAGKIAVAAEHAEHGRSRALTVSLHSQEPVVLELLPPGSLRGSLRQDGKPVEGVMVVAQTTASPTAISSVATGPDGSFRFDKLPPDRYQVSATMGSPMRGMRRYATQTEVRSRKESVVELVVEPGSVTLEVAVSADGGPVGLLTWALLPGSVAASTAEELGAQMAASTGKGGQFGVGGTPLRITEIPPGAYTLCAVPYPREIDQPTRMMAYAERYGQQLPAACQSVKVAAAPPSQMLALRVTVPPLQSEPAANP
jgi:uncharacterized GH25 family protein